MFRKNIRKAYSYKKFVTFYVTRYFWFNKQSQVKMLLVEYNIENQKIISFEKENVRNKS